MPGLTQILQVLLPLVAGGIAGGQPSRSQFNDPNELINSFLQQFEAHLRPGRDAAVAGAMQGGNAANQQIQAAFGGSGALASGAGRVGSAVGGTLGGINAGMAEQQFRGQSAQLATNAFNGAINASPKGLLGRPASSGENFNAFLGDLFSNPQAMAQLFGLFGKGQATKKGDQQPFGQMNFGAQSGQT